VLACRVLTGMVDYPDINEDAPFSAAFAGVGLPVLGAIIAAGAILGILTVLFTFLMGASGVGYAMSRDGLLPAWFAKTHPERKVPTRITWVLGVASGLIAGFLPINEAAELTNIGILLAFVVCIAVIVLRYRRPDLPRSFRHHRHAGGARHRRAVLAVADQLPRPAHLAAVRHLVPDRPGRLLRLRSPQLAAGGASTAR
jgi:APA family basic amino acid/polyamine antiporter